MKKTLIFIILLSLLICYIGKKTLFRWLSLEEYRKKKREYYRKRREEARLAKSKLNA